MSSTTNRKRLVVKVGTAVLSSPGGGLDRARIRALAEELSGLQKEGHQIVLVTSGAIGAGMDRFGWKNRPTILRDKQAAAAVGQVALMEAYESAFGRHGITVAQMLLTVADLEDRGRYLNARNTLAALLERHVVPIINENDTVATEEIQFGDNDTLSAIIAVKTEANILIILTDVDGLLTGENLDGNILPEVFQITPDVEALVRGGKGSEKSAGGMVSKIQAARLAMASGVEVWIASGRKKGIVRDISAGRGTGTRFHPQEEKLSARRQWIAFGRKARGTLILDDGAVKAIIQDKRSLLPSGIVALEGNFKAGDTVKLQNAMGVEIARGLITYSSGDMERIRGKKTTDLESILHRPAPPEVIHRNNLVVLIKA